MEIFTHYEHALPKQIQSSKIYENRIGFWGDVSEVDSITNTCSVVSDQGLTYRDIQVAVNEWVVKDDSKDYASCERNLPPVGARVFVLVPNKDISTAFILCSGYPLGEKNTQVLWTDEDAEQKEVQQQNKIREKITQGGWNIKENYDDGNITLKSADGNIQIELNPAKNDDLEQEQNLKINAWDNVITLTKDGIKIETEKEISVAAKENVNVSSEKEIILESKENFSISTEKGLSIETSSGSDKTSVGNSNLTIGKMMSNLLNQLSTNFVTGGSGSPAEVNPSFMAQILIYKTQWDSMYE